MLPALPKKSIKNTTILQISGVGKVFKKKLKCYKQINLFFPDPVYAVVIPIGTNFFL